MKGSRAIVDLTKIIRPKGIDPLAAYPATVVDDNDPDQLDRVRARIPLIHDHIKDEDLPWAYPIYDQMEGLKGGSSIDRAGVGHIPRKGNRISLHFPTGDPASVFYGGVPVDKANKLPEMRRNYPNRIVFKFKSGMFMIHDTKTKETFYTFPGDVHQCIMGDLTTSVIGQQQTKIVDAVGDKESLWDKQNDMVTKDLSPQTASKIKFEGLLGQGPGNQHAYIKKDRTIKVDGSVRVEVQKDYTVDVQGDTKFLNGGKYLEKATRIDMN